jgi:PPK2 family polyphosphate:nucleotide phosphotransferase
MASIRDTHAFANSERHLADIATCPDPDISGAAKKLKKNAKKIAELQERLWAASAVRDKHRVLLVLQGMDTAGKGGVTNHVMSACGPMGVEYTGFKAPTEEELRHDFLWRIRPRLPKPGMIAIFDRSHYEDVLVPHVRDTIEPTEWHRRIEAINAFERDLAAHATTVIKCFLHLSYDTQRERLLRRLDKPKKRWKFSESDIDTRRMWPRYQDAYQAVLERTNTDETPWYVIPSDDKTYRNWAVAEILREELEQLDPAYPERELDIAALRARLAPPD